MINTVIIDDEKNCISLLKRMLQASFPFINIVGTATQADEGIKLIKKCEPLLVFLDIEMPLKNGFEVIEETRGINYDVVFTTAYNQYAIKAIRFSALDYLLKPIDPEELRLALERLKHKNKLPPATQQFDMLFSNLRNLSHSFSRLSIATAEGVLFISVSDIIYCEATSSYTNFFLKSKDKLLSSKTLKDYEDMLAEHAFFRIHHSYLINLNEIRRYIKGDGGSVVMSNGDEVPVSKRRRDDFLKRLNL